MALEPNSHYDPRHEIPSFHIINLVRELDVGFLPAASTTSCITKRSRPAAVPAHLVLEDPGNKITCLFQSRTMSMDPSTVCCLHELRSIYRSMVYLCKAMCISSRRGKGPGLATIPAQTASTSLFREPPVPGGRTSCRLHCFIEGDSVPFFVTGSLNREIQYLKELIHEKNQNALSPIDAKYLVLLRLKRPIPYRPCQTLSTRIQELDTASSEIVDELDDHGAPLSEYFPQQPPLENLHIIVKLGVQPQLKWPRLSTSSWLQLQFPPPPPSNSSLRSNTVSVLYEKLKTYSLILHIRQQEPAVHIILVEKWPLEEVKEIGGWQAYLHFKKGWVQGRKTIFIFDEAQSLYEDPKIWSGFFKNIHDYDDRFAIAFASYGSPTSLSIRNNTPFYIGDFQRVALRPIDNDDGLGAAGLLFSRMEFDDLVRKQFSSSEHHFHPSFFDVIFDLTGGHVGAIHDFVKIITAHESYHRLRLNPGQLYTWDLFLAQVSPHDLLVRLETSASIFKKGLPFNQDLRDRAITHIFSNVLRRGSVVESKFIIGDDAMALRKCFRNGWLHADKFRGIHNYEETVYIFPSPLHRWIVEWKLWYTVPTIPFESNSILQLAREVIARFSPSLLSTERRIGPGCIQRPPEAQYQDEFYRCCHEYSNGSLITFPEFGIAKGRADFYIPSRQWGVEILREGDLLEQHSGRFSRSELYGTTLPLSDYIMLDCRNTWPKHPQPNIPKLYYVVFSNGYEDVSILDHWLQPVHGGEMRLLPAA